VPAPFVTELAILTIVEDEVIVAAIHPWRKGAWGDVRCRRHSGRVDGYSSSANGTVILRHLRRVVKKDRSGGRRPRWSEQKYISSRLVRLWHSLGSATIHHVQFFVQILPIHGNRQYRLVHLKAFYFYFILEPFWGEGHGPRPVVAGSYIKEDTSSGQVVTPGRS
jgi:hypothetical protein